VQARVIETDVKEKSRHLEAILAVMQSPKAPTAQRDIVSLRILLRSNDPYTGTEDRVNASILSERT